MAYLDEGIGEAYVSPQIEAALGISRSEWLEDPIRWYRHIHPDDKDRWSTEAAEMVPDGKPAAVVLSGTGPRWTGGLVPMRGAAGAARGRPAVVHPRSRVRHHRAQKDGTGAGGRAECGLGDFVRSLESECPPAARITAMDIRPAEPAGLREFVIRESRTGGRPTTRISPDLPVCHACLAEMFDAADPRYHYPYINCTHCGPRYSVLIRLPYDRDNTTMRAWPLDKCCAEQYADPLDRRFHAQPVACPSCGPAYRLWLRGGHEFRGERAVDRAVDELNRGGIVAVKGIGGYHLACDAMNESAVRHLRERKYRKEKPFALMAANLDSARTVVELSPQEEDLLLSTARPIVLARSKRCFHGVAPDNDELGVMLPYTPVHHLLFAAGCPPALVMTSANRSSEPIAYEEAEALSGLKEIADAFLIGDRPIARRVDDSVARVGAFGPMILRRSRGYAPSAVARIPAARPILAVGADLKNTVTLVANGGALVSQHIGDLEHFEALRAFWETVEDLVHMYELRWEAVQVAHDRHPSYFSTAHALQLTCAGTSSVQHHRAHVASVLAEREAWDKRVLGVSLDGTGYGDNGVIWGGEIFTGSVAEGFARVAHLRPADLPGGDAAARFPMQAAAGFLSQVKGLPDLMADPFRFSSRYRNSLELVRRQVRSFKTTSMGRLFDSAAALLGFTREVTFEGQAAMWLEQLARRSRSAEPYSFPFTGDELDFRPLLRELAGDRRRGRSPADCARAFQAGVASGLGAAVSALCQAHGLDTVALREACFRTICCWRILRHCCRVNGSRSGRTAPCRRTTAASASGRRRWRLSCSLGQCGSKTTKAIIPF
ncbi:MAG TPA: carbamoyltransferase HypF [Bryobacteraceae bacterium]|nr:carbamoyltransferase HypF [Bryobacteraceae bacterium]